MESTENISHKSIMELILNMPQQEKRKLGKYLLSNWVNIFDTKETDKTAFQKLLLSAPTWTDEEYKSFIESVEYVNSIK